ncbi:CPBP family intramembrane glutamic endopeptidase [Subtercola boreus]|uniref:CPBP family intramembrane metalloprotease domain-containing protein n=1 Tax=Subtercola boreus TaxID=120213 RepID=A0A3E0WAX2_9MICO|nr:CPBP family intramembrane glutamic endopeptidase [Subtercola boreus]RFA19996.1 CPBP family intramembrane metalloprotease domain-containing protein [Subtercola boreus]RFA20125.1 CPBP family intramembrane metalloprotease domain-containing protein [Subtercola boreus]RFA26452.1 CPBP family intramembrane metalloprotease domain-containing protein [Subtercola boreus]
MMDPHSVGDSRRMLGLEVLVVLGLSLGASAVYSVVSLLNKLTIGETLASQSTSLNGALSDRPTFDLIYQLLAIFFALVPVVLAFYLLARSGVNPFRRLGFDARHPGSDILRGVFLVLVIGVPGIALYFVGRALGITVDVSAAPASTYWWSIPVLILSALRAALTEELIVVGYLYDRLERMGWRKWSIILAAAVLRGSYHLYQGFGPFIGNVVMGVVFGWLYLRWGRVVPLVIAHWIIDIASFVGYAWALATFPQFF